MKPENLESINNELFEALNLDEKQSIIGAECYVVWTPHYTSGQYTQDNIIDGYWCDSSDYI
jgi:hypothetical protein